MIAELGHFALVLAMMVAIAQSIVPMIGAYQNNIPWMRFGNHSAMGQFLLVAISFGCLMHAYVTSDFSVLNVVQNSHSAKPMLYKISGVWGNHEGSMLLWILILALFGLMVGEMGRNLPSSLRARVLGIQGLIGVGFIAFLIFTSTPFLRLDPSPLQLSLIHI